MFLVQDHTVIQQYAGGAQLLQVHAQRFEVMWRDGSAVQLHLVTQGDASAPATFLRALQLQGRQWLVFDLRTVLGDGRWREFEADVLRLQPRDTPGVVFYTLRGAWLTAGAFVAAAQLARCAAWEPEAEALLARAA